MSFSGLCQVCESAEADYACDQCGTQVCEKHYDQTHSVCVQCASVLDEGGDRPGETRPHDGEEDTGPGLGMR